MRLFLVIKFSPQLANSGAGIAIANKTKPIKTAIAILTISHEINLVAQKSTYYNVTLSKNRVF
ncbi:MAG TPA: hypothetical protein V6D28_09505 [Leptolyngbyaceae cyanobacterium]